MQTHMEGREGGRQRQTDMEQKKQKLGMRQRQRLRVGVETGRERHMCIRGERWTDRWRDMQDGGGEKESKTGDPQREMDWEGAENSRKDCCEWQGVTVGPAKKGDELKSLEQDALSGTPLRSDIITSSPQNGS